jgi:hypothetical protein
VASRKEGIPPWILALIALAALGLLANGAFVWISLTGRRDLVRPDYYQAGLEQDARLARRSLAAAYDVELVAEGGEWIVRASRRTGLPSATPGDAGTRPSLEGTACRVTFQRPEDGRLDASATLAFAGGSAERGTWRGPAEALRKGRWDVLIEWERDGEVFMESAFPRFFGE